MSGAVDEHARAQPRVPKGGTVTEAPAEPVATGMGATPRQDRWAWRRRVRANPHQLRIYRAVVAAVGLLLILLGLATGWLPGPGGIPLVLAGLAVWRSEFHWAHRLMMRLKNALHVYNSWTRRRKLGFWLVFLAACALLGWAYLVAIGQPGWFPYEVDRVLAFLPGVELPA